jgi:hypothetical protein
MPPRPSAQEVEEYAKRTNVTRDPRKPIPFIPEPELYRRGPGGREINPDYDTNIGQDILAGARIAVGQGGSNPFETLGLALGGLGGGALNKNLAGKLKHRRDVADVREQNKQIEIKSQAQLRLEAEERRRMQEERVAAKQLWDQGYKETQAKAKGLKEQNDLDLKLLKMEGDDENRAKIAENFSKRNNIQISPDAGKAMRQVQAGDYLTLMDQFGNVHQVSDPETGQPITKLTTSGYLDVLKKVRELSDYDDNAMKSALQQAEILIKDEKLRFKTTTSQSIATINLAKTILKEQGKKTGRVTIGGEVIEIEIPAINNSDGKPMAPQQSTSPFMQGDDPNGTSEPDADATKPTAADLLPKYQDFSAVPVGEDLDPGSLPLDNAPFTKMLDTAEKQAPKGATKFKFRLDGETYEYNFKTKKVRKLK